MRLIFPLLVMAVCWAGLVATPALAQQSPSDQQSSPSDRPADTSAAGTSAAANAESSASSSPESESSETPESESAQPSGASDEPASPGQRGGLRFRFAGTPWPDVLTWFAEEADLALQLDQAPLGTFTFSDPTRSYTVSEALDVLNLTLMKSGYILVRRGRMLQLIDLEVENSDKMISEIAELVAPEDLEERGKSDVVSSVFALGSMTPSAAKEELAQMIGPWGRVIVLDSARQVKVTETASKLIAIRDLLESTATADSDVIEIVLKHRAATEVLEIARPLLGLEPGENAGEDIRLSVGVYGERIYAAGLPGKTGLLKSIIEKADQPLALPENDQANEVSLPVFRTHTVTTADSSTVFDVLQTLLAGTPDARLAIDPKTEAIIAWARPETHQLIAESISEMEGTGTSFKVLDLRRLDPAQALLTINKFFGVSEEGGSGPVVDGDPESGKLWVRGTKEEIELVEKLLQELEGSDQFGGAAGKVRVLPYTGRSAAEALQQVESLWRVMGRENRIRTFTPSGDGSSSQGGLPERRISREPDARVERPSDRDSTDVHRPRRTMGGVSGRFGAAQVLVSTPADPQSGTDDGGPADEATANEQTQKDEGQSDANSAASNEVTINVDGADIIVQFTPAGLVIASEDMEALDAFQSLLESVATPSAAADDLPTIIWLKYIKAEVAAEMVSSVLGGSESSFSSTVDSVAGGLGGGMLGLLGMGGGGDDSPASARSVLTSTGSVNIVPDPRLNALIVQANPVDMQMIELILEKIDIQESPEDIETDAKPALIPVIYQDASDVADVVKSVFGERIAGQQSNGRGGGGGGGGQPSPQDFINALRGRGGRGGRGDNQATSERTKISVAVDKKSNSLVVIATPQDFQEVRDLVQALDYSSQPSEEIVEIAPLRGDVNPEVVRLALESILGQSTGSTSDGTSSSGSTGDRNNGGGDDDDRDRAAEIRRRIEAFRAMRGGGDNDGGRGGFRGFGGRGGFRGGGGPGGGGPGGRGGGEGGRGGGGGGRGGGGR